MLYDLTFIFRSQSFRQFLLIAMEGKCFGPSLPTEYLGVIFKGTAIWTESERFILGLLRPELHGYHEPNSLFYKLDTLYVFVKLFYFVILGDCSLLLLCN